MPPLCPASALHPLLIPTRARLVVDMTSNRMQQMQQMKSDGHGQYREITDEKEVVRLSA